MTLSIDAGTTLAAPLALFFVNTKFWVAL